MTSSRCDYVLRSAATIPVPEEVGLMRPHCALPTLTLFAVLVVASAVFAQVSPATRPSRAPTTPTTSAPSPQQNRKVTSSEQLFRICGGAGQACCVDRGNPLHYCGVGLGCDVAANRCVSPCGGVGQACCAGPDTYAPIGNKSPTGTFCANEGCVPRKQMCGSGSCDPATQRCLACGQKAGDACCPPDAQQATASCKQPKLICESSNYFKPGGTCIACGSLNAPACPLTGCNDGLGEDWNGRCLACGKIGQPSCNGSCSEGGPDLSGTRCVAHFKRPVPAARKCDPKIAPMPTGLILREWMRLGGPSGPMGCPQTDARRTPDGSTAARYVQFENGAISISPDKWPYGVWGAYQNGDHFLYDWTTAWNDEDAVNYDKFLVSIRDTHGHATSVDVLQDMESIPGNILATVFYRKDSHLRKQGTFDDKIIDLQDKQTYFLQLEGCDMPSKINPFDHSTCRQGSLHAIPVTFQAGRGMGDFDAINFSHIAPATSVEASKGSLDDRIAAAVLRDACQTFPWTMYRHEEDYTEIALAKLAYAEFFQGDRCPGRDISNRDEVSASIRRLQPETRTGTQLEGDQAKFFGIIRMAEYDFALNGLIPMVYKYPSAFRPGVLDHVINVLLNKRGMPEQEDFYPLPSVPESENHINMIESARYLTNQILFQRTHDPKYNNQQNGFSEWWLQRLQNFLKTDFIEYNAHPYTRLSSTALQNLYSYSQDPAVKAATKMVLDYLSAKIAVSSNTARRTVPYRRKKTYDTDYFFDHPDPSMIRSLMLAGNTQVLADPRTGFDPGFCGAAPCKWWPTSQAPHHFSTELLMAGLSDYRIPDPILDLIVNLDHRTFYQGFRHYAAEIYAGSPSYLISGGGTYAPYAYTMDVGGARIGQDDDIGLAVATTLVPTSAFLDRGKMVRFLGSADADKRYNLCVAPNFACGTTLQIPAATYPTSGPCWAAGGAGWVFFNRSGRCAHVPVSTRLCFPAAAAKVELEGNQNRRITTKSPSTPPPPPPNPQQPPPGCSHEGYYLAVYRGPNDSWGVLEAYDTYLHHELTFQQFVSQVQRNNPRPFNPSTSNTYMTASGQTIHFIVSPNSLVSSVSPGTSPPSQPMFLWGEVMTSSGVPGNGLITIRNPYTKDVATMDDSKYQTPAGPTWKSPRPRLVDAPAKSSVKSAVPSGTGQPRVTAPRNPPK